MDEVFPDYVRYDLLSSQFDHTVVNHQCGQGDQGKSDDELQAADHEDERAVGDRAKDTEDRHADSRHRHEKHEAHRDVKHPALATRCLHKDSHCGQDEGSQQLVSRTEERPNAHVTGQAKHEAQDQS